MVQTHVFPQNGDDTDGANFGQLIGQPNLTNFVSTGITFSVNYTNPDVDISEGLAYVRISSDQTDAGEDRTNVGYVIQYGGETGVSLESGVINYLYLEPNLGVTDSAYVSANTSDTGITDGALKIGEVDTGNETTTKHNRAPAIDASTVTPDSIDTGELSVDDSGATIDTTLSVTGSATFGSDILTASGTTIFNASNDYVPLSTLEQDAVTVTAGNQLTGGGSVTLGQSVTVGVDDGSGSGLDADLLDGVELANIDWTDVALSRSDVYVSDLSGDTDGITEGTTNLFYTDERAQDGVGEILGANFTYDDAGNAITLTSDSVTVNAGDGLTNGGTVALGGTTTLDVEPADFAGDFLSDDGTDDLQVNIGRGLESDGADAIQFDEDATYTFTAAQTFTDAVAVERTVVAGETVTIDSGTGMSVSGPVTVDGTLQVDGSFTDTVGPIYGDGSITGTGIVRTNGTGRALEPIDPSISSSTFVAISGWTTDNDSDTYDAYRFARGGSIEIEQNGALTLTI